VKKFVIALAMATLGTVVQAETKQKMVGNWVVQTQEDAFDKGGSYLMMTGSPSFIFAVRCLQKIPSFGIIMPNDTLSKGQLFSVKLRVDRGAIVEVDGIAIDEHLIQVDNDFKIWNDLPGGREIAIRLENEVGVSSTQSFKTVGSGAALQVVNRECPIKD
jgi:hypothetical protein